MLSIAKNSELIAVCGIARNSRFRKHALNRLQRANGRKDERTKMKVCFEVELMNFEFWAGAALVAEEINNRGNYEECWEALEEWFDAGEICDETYVNDIVWFDAMDMLREWGLVEPEE